MSPLLAFYRSESPDDHGRHVSDILSQGDDWLEYTHDYIQWLFPNRDPSGVNPGAPVIDLTVAQAFQQQAELRQQLHKSLVRMLAFYGLALEDRAVIKAANWEARKHNWFVRDTHNNLRITRIIKCLKVLGLAREAMAFYRGLVALKPEPDCGISELAWRYWQEAVETG